VIFRETIVRGATARNHSVQLFDSLDSRITALAAFIASGLAADDIVLVVAGDNAWTGAAKRLTASHVDVERAVREGHLIFHDAAETLSKFTRRGWPDTAAFDAVIGTLIRQLVARGRLRVYGEMVDLLAAERDFGAAVELENLWNTLGQSAAFSLFCGYSASHFGPETNAAALKLICRCHSTTRVDVADDLASWLLQSAESDDITPAHS